MQKYRPSAPKSASTLVKESKEALEAMEAAKEAVNISVHEKVECGLKNPCVFGKHNSNFDKNNIGK